MLKCKKITYNHPRATRKPRDTSTNASEINLKLLTIPYSPVKTQERYHQRSPYGYLNVLGMVGEARRARAITSGDFVIVRVHNIAYTLHIPHHRIRDEVRRDVFIFIPRFKVITSHRNNCLLVRKIKLIEYSYICRRKKRCKNRVGSLTYYAQADFRLRSKKEKEIKKKTKQNEYSG
ncbi:hypothetical protein PUN28_018065 [Cardiocondyla obscurior]|uniref:Ribosomal protein L19 n=1 Tax=Cardiocondyla obscurior TaxID=286306 RepID=A0AAW2EHR6_9HYME